MQNGALLRFVTHLSEKKGKGETQGAMQAVEVPDMYNKHINYIVCIYNRSLKIEP